MNKVGKKEPEQGDKKGPEPVGIWGLNKETKGASARRMKGA